GGATGTPFAEVSRQGSARYPSFFHGCHVSLSQGKEIRMLYDLDAIQDICLRPGDVRIWNSQSDVPVVRKTFMTAEEGRMLVEVIVGRQMSEDPHGEAPGLQAILSALTEEAYHPLFAPR